MSKPIYGTPCKSSDVCTESNISEALQLLRSIIRNMRTAIERFYNSAFGVAPVVANMRMTATLPTSIVMRLRWIDNNPDTKFDKTNPYHLDGLKFVYNINNRDWRTDPLFIAMG
jgi:hypothetical protein